MTWDELRPLLGQATLETLQMTAWSAVLTAIGGTLVGVLLVLTERGGLLPLAPLNKVLGAVVNIGRALPFIILMVAIIPFTRAITGTTIGTTAAIVPLTVAAIPFYARLVETALHEVEPGVIDAARAMGASRAQIVRKVLLREARPGLAAGMTITVVAIVGYSAMAGAIGGGGLGDLAVRYGYQRFEGGVMLVTVVLLVAAVQVVQTFGDLLVRRLSHK
ncbi:MULTISPECIES: methionine ABC transporter permease [Actinomadura]|uniref:Methionine ABC transporter permease n=1 Tax=Actinomadura yumaensis TaxID=111807 RepID=A0ABW2CUF0_9ACTN|nr:methionine ABC transporter permease [Actinomadura sp. J1-007]MWK37558.1 methionine ABC transporter permease MetI [Actinomadura sp. J1-007]